MKLLLEIPDAFSEHFAMDKFKDSLMRICADISEVQKRRKIGHQNLPFISGNYERELVDVLAPAFARAVVVSGAEHAKRVKQVLRAEYQRAVTEVQFWDTILQTCPHYRNRYFDRLHGLNYSQSYKGRTAAAWLEYWRGRVERVSNWLREFRPRRRGAKCK